MADGRRRPNELKAGAVLSYAVIAVQFVVAMVYTPLMLRLLGQTEYGLYSLVGSIVSYLSLLSFGFGGAYIRFYARFKAAQNWSGVRRLNGLFLVVFTSMGLIAVLGGTLLTLNVDVIFGNQFAAQELATARVLFAVLVVNLAITFPTTVFDAYVTAHERFIFQKVMQVIKAIVNPLIVLPVLLLGYQSIGMAVATTAVNIVFTACTVIFARFKLKMHFTFRPLDWHLLREVSTFSSYLFINIVVDQINWNVDKFIIGRFRGAAPVAVYSVAATFNSYYLMFSTAISSVFIPRVNAMVATRRPGKDISDLFTRVGRIQLLVLGLIVTGFAFFGRPFIELWAGPGYTDAYFIALLLMVPVTIPLIQNLGIEIQKAKNLHQFRSWLYLGMAIANILLSIPMTQRFGAVGAAAATAIALIVGNGFIMNWHYQVRVGLDIRDFWRQMAGIMRGMIPAAIVGTIIVMTVDLDVSLLVVLGAAYTAVYVAGAWWLGMNAYERGLFGSPVRSAISRWRRA